MGAPLGVEWAAAHRRALRLKVLAAWGWRVAFAAVALAGAALCLGLR